MLEAGIKGSKEITVTEDLTASALRSGLLDVFATPMMICLCEETAHVSVEPLLEEGQGTVGTKVDVAHIAATPVGMKVRCETVLTEVDRRRLVFAVQVFDEVEKIAEGTHERFIIDNQKFMEKVKQKG